MLTLRIALRYFFSRKSHHAVNVITRISIAGVAVATAAIVVVLSVFNGFRGLTAEQTGNINAAISVLRSEGNREIADGDSLADAIAALPGVKAVSPVVEQRGLLIYGKEQMPVVFRGVNGRYGEVVDFSPLILAGYMCDSLEGFPAAVAMIGVANYCGIIPSGESVGDLYVPRRKGRINPANPAASYRRERLIMSGVAQSDRIDFDADHLVIPLESARKLLDYTTEATSIDVAVKPGEDITTVKNNIAATLPQGYEALDVIEQEKEAFRMIAVEKWITFALLSFILIVAAFNIFSTVSLLIVEKRDNMATLSMLGLSAKSINAIFGMEGFLVTVTGGIVGVGLGVGLSLAQQYGGFIKLSGDASALTTDVYPVEVSMTDIAAIFGLLLVIGLLSGYVSRLISSRLLKKDNSQTPITT